MWKDKIVQFLKICSCFERIKYAATADAKILDIAGLTRVFRVLKKMKKLTRYIRIKKTAAKNPAHKDKKSIPL